MASISRFFLPLLLWAVTSAGLHAQQAPSAADVLEERPNLAEPAERARSARAIRTIEENRKAAAIERAREMGLPVRIELPGGGARELMAFDEGSPLYAVTYNQEAAITTAAEEMRTLFGVDGSGSSVGVWDGGAVRPTHEAFSGRISVKDGAVNNSHATHIGGTIGAAGTNTRARGMSTGVLLDSYDWNSDKSEMTSRGAAYANEPGSLHLSNHSYGYLSGWASGSPWQWYGRGTDTDAAEENFGKYNSYSRDVDSLAYNLPYYLTFWAAGNDRSENPAEGASVVIGGQTVTYDSTLHPSGDGLYREGYDTIGFESLAKNVVTVGGVSDAVTSGQRDISRAGMASFSSWGPTDDGRIKPDIVANGTGLYSTFSGSDSSYGTSSGTSMATANATGSAQLLASYFAETFPGHTMRASTLKGLILHTADDLGIAGPDYRYGWGLMNTSAAAEHIAAHKASPGSQRIVEAELNSDATSMSHTFTWDGVSPIRATLTWTDPAGAATSFHDDRKSRLVNNLDLAVEGPGGSIHQPFVMPYVGDWSQASLSAPATRGKNNTDNVEQVFLATPVEPGVYTATVTVDGILANNRQVYSLIISGSADIDAPAPEIASSDTSMSSDAATINLTGSNFHQGSTLSFTLSGEPERTAFSHEIVPGQIQARLDTRKMAGGSWDLVLTNPDGKQAILPAALSIAAPLWTEDFDSEIIGWTHSASLGSTNWSLSSTSSRSPSHSFHAPGPASINLDALYSQEIDIPAAAEDLALGFWHSYSFQSGRDGGVIELSTDSGKTWIDVTESASGASFITGGYNSTLSKAGPPKDRNPLADRNAWSGSTSGFTEVVVKLNSASYAGKKLQVRWQLGTDNSTASDGWFIDDVSVRGATSAPTSILGFTTPAWAEEPITSGTSVNLHVEAQNSDGTNDITYTWTVNASRDYPVDFSDNGTATAGSTTAYFSQEGTYLFEVTARNGSSQSISSEVEVVVQPAMTALLLDPETVEIPVGTDLGFSAVALDQFDHPLPDQPVVQWSVDPTAGGITAEGVFTAADSPGGPYTLTATVDEMLTATAEIRLRDPHFGDWQETYFSDLELTDASVSGEEADPESDGMPNLLEYALGGNPREPSRRLLPVLSLEQTDQGKWMVLAFSRPAELKDLAYAVESSSDLIGWTAVEPGAWTIEPGENGEAVTVRVPLTEEGRTFLRLQVNRTQ